MIDLQTLSFFKTVANCGSFSAASHELNYAQSNVSTKIIQLEKELQTSLFYRTNRGVILTAKGKLFLDYTEKLLCLLQTAETAMLDNGEACGSLKIGSLETIAQTHLPYLLSDYHKKNPNVQLFIQTGNTTELTKAVLNRDLDAAFISGDVEHPDLQKIKYKQEKLIIALSFNNQKSLHELQNETLLVFSQGCYYRRLLEQLLQDNKIAPKQAIEYNSIGAMIASLCAGFGITLLPCSILSKYKNYNLLRTIDVAKQYSLVDTYFIYRSDYYFTTAFSLLVKWTHENSTDEFSPLTLTPI